MCHCLDCQRRTGSAYGIQARFPVDTVTISGDSKVFTRTADSGNQLTFHFCPVCGSTVHYQIATRPDLIAIPIGAFADPAFPPPTVSVYEARRHPWAKPTIPMDHFD